MTKILDGKVAIIAGGAQGIGQAVAIAMAEAGAAVVIADLHEAGLAATATQINQAGGRCLTQRCDITNRDEVDAAVALAVSAYGTVDILFNSAMIIRVKPLEQQTEADLMDTLRVNVLGPMFMMQACFPHMKQHGGKIINCGSASGTSGVATHASYAASKEAVRGLTKSAANEWGQYGINVNVIMPLARTTSAEAVIKEMGDVETLCQQSALRNPMRRYGDPKQDIAPVVIFLASPAANYVTGRSIFVDGGMSGFM